jgi:hypothetical protein
MVSPPVPVVSRHSVRIRLSASVRTPKADPTDDHSDTGCRAFLNDPASLRSRFLNDVVVRKGWCNDESCQGSTSKNCSHEVSLSCHFALNENPAWRVDATGGVLGNPTDVFKGRLGRLSKGSAKQTHGTRQRFLTEPRAKQPPASARKDVQVSLGHLDPRWLNDSNSLKAPGTHSCWRGMIPIYWRAGRKRKWGA